MGGKIVGRLNTTLGVGGCCPGLFCARVRFPSGPSGRSPEREGCTRGDRCPFARQASGHRFCQSAKACRSLQEARPGVRRDHHGAVPEESPGASRPAGRRCNSGVRPARRSRDPVRPGIGGFHRLQPRRRHSHILQAGGRGGLLQAPVGEKALRTRVQGLGYRV